MNKRSKNYHRRIAWVVIVAMQHASIAPVLAAPNLPVPATGNRAYSQSGNVGTVNQTQAKQVFQWNSFDIGNGFKVVFQQPNSGAALNRVVGSEARPSEIRGVLQSVTPDGKGGAIYLINQNGIIFGSTAQVNVGSLVASQLNISDSNFANYSLADIMGKLGQPAFEVFKDEHGNPILHEIKIDSGAKIHSNGLEGVKIFAADITNKGTIETPDGQALLAASKGKVYLMAPATPNSVTPQLAGFLVEVDAGGNVSNIGNIVAERGNITLMGMAVNQSGRLTATTAAGQSGNGSIRLLARDHASPTFVNQSIYTGDGENGVNKVARGPLVDALVDDPNHHYVAQSDCASGQVCTGSVTFGAHSVTEVLPDNSSAPQPSSVGQNLSVVEVMGKNIALQDDALIHATGGVVQLTATSTPKAPKPGGDPASSLVIGANATIDVSGAAVAKSVQDNVVAAKLVGANLADVPVQRDGALDRADVLVDARLGTKVANVTGEIEAMTHSAAERLTAGGSVKLSSGGAVSIAPNAVIDISGGKITYAGGDKTTTYVHGGGAWKEISQADPNVYYDSVKNITVHNAPGYVDGKDAGRIEINSEAAPALAANVIKGGVTTGVYQRDKSDAPKAGTLTLNLRNKDNFSTNTVNIVTQQAYRNVAGQISDQLFANSGLSDFLINSGGDVNIGKGANIRLADGGRFAVVSADAGNNKPTAINVDGAIRIVGGTVSLNNQVSTGQINSTLQLGSNASIDTSGLWINEYLDSKTVTPHFIDGGRIDLKSGSLLLRQGSTLSSNGGALYDAKKQLTPGLGGTIALATNYADATSSNRINAAQLQQNATLSAFSLSEGGTLSLTHNGFVIGNGATRAGTFDVLLTPDYFRQGGFSAYSLTSTLDGIRVAKDTRVDLRGENWTLPDRNLLIQQTGADMTKFVATTTLPDYLRKPVDLSLNVNAQPTSVGSLVAAPVLSLETGASIHGDPGAAIKLSSQALQILINGAIEARGGSIAVTLQGTDNTLQKNYKDNYFANQAIVLGANAALDTSAIFVAKPKASHSSFRDFVRYDGGKIALNANNGYVVAENGSQLRVDGAAQTMDVLQYGASGRTTQVAANVAADAGTLHLQAAEGMLFDADISGKAANVSGAKGGRLEVALDTNLAGAARLDLLNLDKPAASTIHLTQSAMRSVPDTLVQRDKRGEMQGLGDIRAAVSAPNSVSANNSVLLSADKIAVGGFDALQLTATNTQLKNSQTSIVQQLGSIAVDGNVDLSLRQSLELNANTLTVNKGGNAKLSAGYLAWGSDSDPTSAYKHDYAKAASSGNGILKLAGNFIDLIGKLTTTNIKQTTLQSSGDIRARDILNGNSANVVSEGSLTTAGNLSLQAQQIYPPSAHHFTFNVQSSDPAAKLTILPQAGTPGSVLSAGGTLTFNAPTIEQYGTVKAPLGSITMNATNSLTLGAGSNTSIALDTLVPFGAVDSNGKWQVDLPQKNILLQAPKQTIANGAVVDIRGGGDVYEYQFIAGPGGSKDVLADAGSSFAIVPTLALAYAPLNTLDASMQAPSGWSQGQVVSLNINGGLQTYAVLPARYAMLPGALLITPSAKYDGVAPGSSFTLADGTQIVAGKMGYAPRGDSNTPLLQDSLWSAFAVQTRDQVFERSEYRLQYASGLSESTSTSNLPQDAGSLQLLAQTSAIFAGELRAAGADGGHGGRLDIQANDIAVVKALSNAPHSGLELLDSQLSGLSSVESIFLGGVRQSSDAGTQLSVAANTVRIAENAVLNVQELVLAAKDKITVAANALISASGARNPRSDAEAVAVSGDGAILRLSSVNQADIERSGASAAATQGSIDLAASAQLRATKAIAVDVTQGANLAGALDASGGSLAFSAPQISIGGGSSGLRLRADQLRNGNDTAHPNLQQLILNSSNNLDVYSGLSVSADDLQISAANLRSFANANDTVALKASNTLTLTGRGTAATGSSGDSGRLQISAQKIVLGGGQDSQQTLSLNNFNNQTQLSASERVIAKNKLSLDAGGSIAVVTPLLTSADGAELELHSSDAVAITGGSGNSGSASGTFGSVSIFANTAQIDTAVVLPSGRFAVNAAGTHGVAGDDIVIGASNGDAAHDHAIIDIAGRTLTIGDQTVETGGGAIELNAAHGNVVATAGSRFNVSAGGNRTDAGAIKIAAENGNAQVDAQLSGVAANDHSAGSFVLDAKTIGGFAGLLKKLIGSGFTESIALRQRSGDIAIAAQDTIKAHHIDIEADTGKLDIAGKVDASGSDGGSVLFAAGTDLNVLSTATIDAHATGANGNGGEVTLVAKNGFMNLADGSRVAVGGNGSGKNGRVTLQVSRTKDGVITHTANDATGDDGANGLALTHFGALIDGAKSIDLVGMRHYLAAKISDVISAVTEQAVDAFGFPLIDASGNPVMQVVGWQGVPEDTTVFMSRAMTWAQQLFGNSVPNNVRVMPGVDIYSNDNLVVDQMIDLYDNNSGLWRYGSNGDIPGVLSLRAAGNLTIDKPITDGFISFLSFMNPQVEKLYGASTCEILPGCSGLASGASWSINLAAGADFAAASMAQVNRGAGDVVLGLKSIVANPFYDGAFDPNPYVDAATVVRTGTGDIHVAAGGSVIFLDNAAAIYSAGVNTPFAKAQDNSSEIKAGYSYEFLQDYFNGSSTLAMPEFPLDGGNVTVAAGNDIAVRYVAQLPPHPDEYGNLPPADPLLAVTRPTQSSDWLLRIGDAVAPMAWGIAPSKFGGGIAALAGGNVNVSAGGNINYVQIAAPTVGKQLGNILNHQQSVDDQGAITYTDVLKDNALQLSQIGVYGGGNVAVNAGGNIASSSILVDGGKGAVTAGRGLLQAQGAQVANLIGIGDAQVVIKAHDAIVTEAIYNPLAFFQSDDPVKSHSAFLNYSSDSSVSLFSAAGDVIFKNDIQNLGNVYSTWVPLKSDPAAAAASTLLMGIMPAQLATTAATGSIAFNNGTTLLPDGKGDLSLIAAVDIDGHGQSLLLPDVDTSVLPLLGAANSAGVKTQMVLTAGIYDQLMAALTSNQHAQTPLHNNDRQPARISAGRDIANLQFTAAKAADIFAGRDIVNNTFSIQNLRPSDVSQIEAGRDLIFSGSNNLKIQISGPGRLDILAGRDVDLGNAVNGVKSVGNSENPALGDEPAATISVLAGLGSAGLNYDGFIQKYILGSDALLNYVTSNRFGGDVGSYVSAVSGVNYTKRADAIAALKDLANSGSAGKAQALAISKNIYLGATRMQQRELVLNTYFNELKQGGIEAQEKSGEGIARAYRAIDTLFPDASAAKQFKQLSTASSTSASTGYAGDIRLTQSVIQGFGDGDINLIAPGGSIDVGLPVATTSSDVQGVVVGGRGSINAYVRDSINVNRSRIIVQDGGNILGFARFGNIDAGRGSRTKLTLPPPRLTQDSKGNLLLVSSAALSGSGIQAGCSSANCKGGDVYLFAPNGIIDAGDAGISSSGNIFLLANKVVHADVINAAGSITGAPAAPTIDIGLGGGDVAASAVQSAQELAANAASGTDQGPLGQRGLALLTVDILGYGSSQDDDDKRKSH